MATEQEVQNEAEGMVGDLMKAIAERIPIKLVPAENRRGMAEEFVAFLGKLVEFFEANLPSSAAKNAAILVFVQRLGLDRVPEDSAFVTMVLVDATKSLARKARKARRGD